MNLIISAFENAQVDSDKILPKNEEVLRQLHSAKNIEGAIGKISIDEYGNVDSSAVVEKMVDGQPVVINE